MTSEFHNEDQTGFTDKRQLELAWKQRRKQQEPRREAKAKH